MPAQFTPDQIINLVQRLKGTCSQFHDGGWWSYELCHMQQFRPFHVDISTDPAGLPKYEIRDVRGGRTTGQVRSESAREGCAGTGVEVQRGGLVGTDYVGVGR